MGMSVSPQIWQQFIDLVFQDDLIKCKQNFDVIMDDMFIHSTAEEHMDDLIDLFKVLRKYGLKLSPHKCQFFKKKIWNSKYSMGMGMSVSPQIWQQFIDLVFQDDLIKHKQNFDVIMDDTFIHSTAEEHMDDLIDLCKVLKKYGLKLSPHKCQFFKKKIWNSKYSMGMGMSVSPQIWQQFVDLVFQDDLIKRKQNFDVIMDDTFIHSTAEENMDDLIDLCKVLRKYGLKLSPHKCQFFKKKIWNSKYRKTKHAIPH